MCITRIVTFTLNNVKPWDNIHPVELIFRHDFHNFMRAYYFLTK